MLTHFFIILSLIAHMWTHIFYRTENNIINFCVITSDTKKETFCFQSHEIILFQRETYNSFASWKKDYEETRFSEKTYENERKWGKNTRCWAEELRSILACRGNKVYKETPEEKCLESSWAVFNSIFINNRRFSQTLKGRTFFFISFAKNFIIQLTWNTILYYWHASTAINYGKLLVLFFFKVFPVPTIFSFFFWFDPDERNQ